MPFRNIQGCPHCASQFQLIRTKGYCYRRCPTCIGIWISREVLQYLIADITESSHMYDELDSEAPLLQIEGEHKQRKRPCPACRELMCRGTILLVAIDYCENAEHGIWLDKDELLQILTKFSVSEDMQPCPPTSFTSLLNDFFICK